MVATNASTYQWYYQKPDTSTWTALKTGGTSATLSVTAAAKYNGYKYRCLVSNAAGGVYTETATLTVNTQAEPKPTITTQPANATVNEGTKTS